ANPQAIYIFIQIKTPPAFTDGVFLSALLKPGFNKTLVFSSVRFFLFLFRDYCFSHVCWAWRVVCEFHRELATTRSHGTQGADVTEHFGQRYFSFNTYTRYTSVLTVDHTATTVQVTDNITYVIFRSEHVHLHDRFQQLWTRFWHRLTESAFSSDFKRDCRRVYGVECTVEQFNFHVQHREASQWASRHHAFKAFLNCWVEFF